MLIYILLELVFIILIISSKTINVLNINNIERLLPIIISTIFIIKKNLYLNKKTVLLFFLMLLADIMFVVVNNYTTGIAIFMIFHFLILIFYIDNKSPYKFALLLFINLIVSFIFGKKNIIVESLIYFVFSIYNMLKSKSVKLKYSLIMLLLCDLCIGLNYIFDITILSKIEYLFYILFQILLVLYCTDYKENTWYKLLSPIIIFLMKIYYNPTIVNKEYIPESGSVIIAGNHKHALDPILVDCCTKRVVHTLAKKDLHDSRFGFFFRALETIPVDLKASHNKDALISAIEVLESNGAINLSPEAKRNYTKEILLPFKLGAVVMAKRTDTIIVPYSITGDYKFRSKNLKIEFGKPLDVSKLEVEEANKLLFKKVKKLLVKNKDVK